MIDCRYPYEYQGTIRGDTGLFYPCLYRLGGHIDGASNIGLGEDMRKTYFDSLTFQQKISGDTRNVLVFYCEYSQERGPRM